MSWAVVFRIRQYLNDSLRGAARHRGVLGVVLAALDDRLEKSFRVSDASG